MTFPLNCSELTLKREGSKQCLDKAFICMKSLFELLVFLSIGRNVRRVNLTGGQGGVGGEGGG